MNVKRCNEFHALNHLLQNSKTLVIKQVQTTKKQVLFSYLNPFYTVEFFQLKVVLVDKQKPPQLTHRSKRQVRCVATGHVSAL